MRVLSFAAVLGFIACSPLNILAPVFAQQAAPVFTPQADNLDSTQSMAWMDHSAPVAVIDGKVHPEQIPDVVAYRLYFISVGELPNPTKTSKSSSRQWLRLITHRSRQP
ncbi:MAG: hypothetical protein JOZ33_17605 [Acidobacteriaceae bacterium]|nr:hypothetical protein [Acidobacteriaceae bacterium]